MKDCQPSINLIRFCRWVEVMQIDSMLNQNQISTNDRHWKISSTVIQLVFNRHLKMMKAKQKQVTTSSVHFDQVHHSMIRMTYGKVFIWRGKNPVGSYTKRVEVAQGRRQWRTTFPLVAICINSSRVYIYKYVHLVMLAAHDLQI